MSISWISPPCNDVTQHNKWRSPSIQRSKGSTCSTTRFLIFQSWMIMKLPWTFRIGHPDFRIWPGHSCTDGILFVSNAKLNWASRLLIGPCCEVLRPCLPPARPIQLPVGFLHMSQEQSKEAQLPTWLLKVAVVSVVQFDSTSCKYCSTTTALNLDAKSTDCNYCDAKKVGWMEATTGWDEWMMMVILIDAVSLSLSSGQASSVLIVVPMCWITHSMVQSSNPKHGIRVFCVLGSQVLSDCELALWKLVIPVPAIQRRHIMYHLWDSRVRRGVSKLFQSRNFLYPADVAERTARCAVEF